MTSAHRWQERQQLRRLERRRRRGGHRRGPVVIQRCAQRTSDGVAGVRARIRRSVRGDRPLVLMLAGALALAVVVLSGPAQSYFDGRERVEGLQATATALELENDQLRQRVEDLEDPTTIELLAREQQGFIRPGEVPYTLVPPEVDRPRITAPRDQDTGSSGPWYQRAWESVRDRLG